MLDQLSKHKKGLVSVIGCFFLSYTIGHGYLWSSINIYVVSYFKNINPESGLTNNSTIYFPLSLLPANITVFFTPFVYAKFGIKSTLLLISFLLSGVILLASYMPSYWSFLFFFGVLPSTLCGFLYPVASRVGHAYFPNKRGRVTGFCETGFGLGALGFNTIALYIVNPGFKNPEKTGFYQDSQILDQVPILFKILALKILLTMLTAFILLRNPPANNEGTKESDPLTKAVEYELTDSIENNSTSTIVLENKESKGEVKPQNVDSFIQEKITNSEPSEKGNYTGSRTTEENLTEEDKNIKWYSGLGIIFAVFLSANFCFNIIMNYKIIGFKKYAFDDKFLTWAGGLAALCGGIFRPIIGELFDHFGFLKVYRSIITAEIIASVVLHFFGDNHSAFVFVLSIGFICLGAHYVIFQPYLTLRFGYTKSLSKLGFVYLSITMSTIFQMILSEYEEIGGPVAEFLFAMFLLIDFVILRRLI